MKVKDTLFEIVDFVLAIAWILVYGLIMAIGLMGYLIARGVGYIVCFFSKKCEYWSVCPLYREDSYTCQNGGGEYCGMWRRYKGYL